MANFFRNSLPYLYSTALFLSATLLFLVQPMIAKMILPFLGGSSAVWNTCLFFFQSVLLLGYLYAHVATSWWGIRRHIIVHLALLAAALYFLPIATPVSWLERAYANPVYQVFHGTTLHGAQNLDPAKRLQPRARCFFIFPIAT